MPIGIFGSSSSPFDEVIERATAENQTSENWGLILDICDKVKDGGSKAAKDCLLSLKKRLNHRDPHIVLLALTVLDGCVSNCGSTFINEVCSREFIAELRSKATGSQRQVAEKSRDLIKKWAETECKSDSSLRAIPTLYGELKSDGLFYPDGASPTPTKTVSRNKEAEQKEDEEFAKAILLSLKEEQKHKPSAQLYPTQSSMIASASNPSPTHSSHPRKSGGRSAKALYDFEAVEENELTFSAGELITVTDDSDPNWWKGSNNRGEGLFPSSFVTYDLSVTVPTAFSGAGQTAEGSASSSSKKKGVQFDDRVEVKMIEKSIAAVMIDEQKLDRCLELLQNADPTGERPDPVELIELEEQTLAMAPLIEREMEALDKQTNMLSDVNAKLVDAFNLYHAAMKEASDQLRAQLPMSQQTYVPPTSNVGPPMHHPQQGQPPMAMPPPQSYYVPQ